MRRSVVPKTEVATNRSAVSRDPRSLVNGYEDQLNHALLERTNRRRNSSIWAPMVPQLERNRINKARNKDHAADSLSFADQALGSKPGRVEELPLSEFTPPDPVHALSQNE